MNHIRLLLYVVLLATCAVFLVSCASRTDADGDGRLLEQVQQARDVEDLGVVYEKACGNASKAKLDRLKTCRHAGIAIRAAWEEVRHTIPAETPKSKNTPTRISPEAIQCFLGFVERRLPVRQPWWWKDAMVKAKYMYGTADSLKHRDRVVCCLTSSESWNYSTYQATQAGLESPVGTSVATTNGSLCISRGRETFDVPKSLIKKANESLSFDIMDPRGIGCCVNVAAVDAKRFMIIFYNSGIARGCPLFCVSRSSGKIIWEATVWAERPIGGFGAWFSFPTLPIGIEIADGVVYVFGLCPWSAYIEAFSLADGKNVFRFSTSY